MTLAAQHVEIIQNIDLAIAVMRNAGEWLQKTGKGHSEWWDPKNLTKEFLGQYARTDEFFVGLVDGTPAVAAILQAEQTLQDWSEVDNDALPDALYIHYLAVHRDFSGHNLSGIMLDFAQSLAHKKHLPILRLDTDADERKLCDLYEHFGFKIVATLHEDHGRTALFQKQV